MQTFDKVIVSNLDRTREDEFTSFCFEQGAQGVFEDLAFTQPDVTYNPEISLTEKLKVNVIFEQQMPQHFVKHVEEEFDGTKAEHFTEQNKDWLEEWKKGFEPFELVAPFWVVPSWRDVPPQAKEVIRIDPGMAFGTGTHETTRLASQLIVQVNPKNQSVIDVGSGTGILAMVAEKMGAAKVICVDNDPECLRVANENLAINEMSKTQVVDNDIADINEKFDLVIANIIDGVLVQLKPYLLNVTKNKMILSGILKEHEEQFTKSFLQDTKFKITKRLEDGEWIALLLEQ